METRSQKMIATIEKIIQLMKMSDSPSTEYFCDFFIYILGGLNKPHQLHRIAENILRAYGGMGTFGDVAIWKDGGILMKEQDEFDALREILYVQCKEAIAEARGAD
jgi:hypothetical protein